MSGWKWRAFWWGFTHPFSDARQYAQMMARRHPDFDEVGTQESPATHEG